MGDNGVTLIKRVLPPNTPTLLSIVAYIIEQVRNFFNTLGFLAVFQYDLKVNGDSLLLACKACIGP